MARARRRPPAELPAWITFVPVGGRPVVPQHEEWHREFLEWLWTGGQRMGLDWIMGRFRLARETAAAAAAERGEFFTTSSWDWARHLLGPDVDKWEVKQLTCELPEEWKPRL